MSKQCGALSPPALAFAGVPAGCSSGLHRLMFLHLPLPPSCPLPPPADTPEVLASNGAGPGALSFVHVLRRCQGEKVAELVRCRTTWRAGEATSSASSSDL